MPLSEQEQRGVVWLAKHVRDQLHGARKWDEAGIAHAVKKVAHLHLADVAMAAVRAADDRNLETPAPIGNPRAQCWRERATDRPQPVQPFNPADTCGICGKTRPQCEAATYRGHQFESCVSTRRAARRNQETHP